MGGSKERFYTDITSTHMKVTGSCIPFTTKFPNTHVNHFVTDCGIFQENDYTYLNEILPVHPKNVDSILVTHSHADHIARIPLLVKNGYKKPIYTTKTTREFMSPALYDSVKVLRETSKKKGKKLLYNECDVDKTLHLLKPCLFEKTYQIDKYTKITFFKNGHLLGASLILVQLSYPGMNDINILFTGDYNCKNMFFDVPDLPDWVLNMPLTIVQEATYGNINSSMMEKKFRVNILKAIAEEKNVIVPIFSLGRAQEILYELKLMQDSGELGFDIPIYLDGNLAQRYTQMYINLELGIKEEMKNFLPQNLTNLCVHNRMATLKDLGKKIILTTSGMGSFGPAQLYLPEYIQRENALIHFTGYTAEGTLGQRIKSAEPGEIVQIGGIMVKKKALVEYTSEYSAHAKADEMIAFLKKFKKINLVLINHGETSKKEFFAKRVLNEVQPKQVGILGPEFTFRINPYGLVKTIPK